MTGVEGIYEEPADVREPMPSHLALVPFHEIEIDTAPIYLVKDLIPRDGLTVVWGPPKCGKSFLTFDIVMHVVLGREYRGRHVEPGPVVYVACEGAHGFKARIAAFRQRHLNGETPLFFLVPSQIDLIEEHNELARQIALTLHDTAPVAIVLDTLNRSLHGSENSDEDMSDYIKAADALREGFQCAVIVVHHCGTEGTRPRGHTSLTGAVDAQLAVKRDASGLITVAVEWMKDGQEGSRFHSRLEVVEVGIDDHGDPITSCVVVPAAGTTQAGRKPLAGYNKTACDALIAVVDNPPPHDDEDPSGCEHLETNRTSRPCPVPKWKEEFYARCIDASDTKPDTLLKRFKRAAEELQRRGLVDFRDGNAWLIWPDRT